MAAALHESACAHAWVSDMAAWAVPLSRTLASGAAASAAVLILIKRRRLDCDGSLVIVFSSV